MMFGGPPPPPPQAGPPPASLPPPATGGRANLLADIQKGKALKHVDAGGAAPGPAGKGGKEAGKKKPSKKK
jgi:hypothetical protein